MSSENPPEYNIHGTKINRTVVSNKYHPLMAKCQKNLKYLQHNRSVPKPRAHIRNMSISSLKKPQFAFRLSTHESFLQTNDKIKPKKSLETLKRNFPKPEHDSIKSCQPAKKILKNNSFQNSSNDSNKAALLSERIKVKNKKQKRFCSTSLDNDSLLQCVGTSTAHFSDKDTDEDFEGFVKKHKGKHSLQSNKSRKKGKKKSFLSSSDEEDENEKNKLKCKKKKTCKIKSPNREKTVKVMHEQRSRNRPDSHCVTEPKELLSDKQINDKVKVKKKTCDLKFLRSQTKTEDFPNHERITRSKSKCNSESSESESAEIGSNNIYSDSSDDSMESATNPLFLGSAESTSVASELINKTTSIQDVHEKIELNVSNDMSMNLINQKNTILCSEKEQSNQKPSLNSKVEKAILSSQCSVVIEQIEDTDKKSRTSNSKYYKNYAMNDSSTLTNVNNDIVIEISDGEECNSPNQSNLCDTKCSSRCSLEPNKQLLNLNLCANVKVEDAVKESAISSSAECIESKNEHEDSDVEIVDVKACEPALSKHNDCNTFTTESSSISQEKLATHANVVKQHTEKDSSKVAISQLNTECETAMEERVPTSSENCKGSKNTSEHDDSDIEVIEFDACKPTPSKNNHNSVLLTNSTGISQEKTLDTHANVVKQHSENDSLKISAEWVNTICEASIEERVSASSANCTESKRTSEHEDSDVEIIEIDACEPTLSNNTQNSFSAAKSSSIFQEQALDSNINVEEQHSENDSFNVPAKLVGIECEAKVSFSAAKNLKKMQSECTNCIVDNNGEVTAIETNSAAQKENVLKGKEHAKTEPLKDEENKAINDGCMILSNEKVFKDLDKMESGEFVKSPSKSTLREFVYKEDNAEGKKDSNKFHSLKRTVPNNEIGTSLCKNLNVPVSDESDCIILEPMACVTETLKEGNYVPLKNENSKSSCGVSEFNTETTQQNSAVKSSTSDCPPDCKSAVKNLIFSNNSNKNDISIEKKSSKKSLSDVTQDLEHDCIILGDKPDKVLSQDKIKCSSLQKEEALHKKFAENKGDKSLNSVIGFQSAKILSSDHISELNQNELCLASKTKPTNNLMHSIETVQSSNATNAINDESINIFRQNNLAENLEKSQKKPMKSSSILNEKASFASLESSCNFPQNIPIISDGAYCNVNCSEINFTEEKVQCKVEKEEESVVKNSTIYLEKSTEQISDTKIPLLNKIVQCTNRHEDLQNRLEIPKNVSCDIDIKPCVYLPNHVSPTRDQIQDNNMSCNLNSQNSPKEFKKELQCNYAPHSSVIYDDASSVPFDNKDSPSVKSVNNVTLDSLTSFKTSERNSLLHHSTNELDAFSESMIYELSCTENKSILPLLNLYRNEVTYYQKLKQTVKNVDAGIRTALELQVERLKHLAFSIQNIVQNDPCFTNSFNEKSHLPIEHEHIEKYSLQDKVPYSLAEYLKKSHVSKNRSTDFSSCSTSSVLRNESSKNTQILEYSKSFALCNESSKDSKIISNFCNEAPLQSNNLPELSLESLHENSSHCVEKSENFPIKSEPMYELNENQYFAEEIKYSKSAEFLESQPEAFQELRNSKCCVCNKPAVGACYFCCSVFYCSVDCSESEIGKYHREACSKEFPGS